MLNVEEYVSGQESLAKERLSELDALIKGLSDKITTKISWAMPTYVLRGSILQLAAFKNHIGIYPGAEVMEAFGKRLKEEGLSFSKGGFQLPFDKPMPAELIKDIALFAIKLDSEESQVSAKPRVRRSEKPLPDQLKSRLIGEGLLEAYSSRPRYQRTDYITWIESAKQSATKERRISKMIEELRNADAYMGMPYNAK